MADSSPNSDNVVDASTFQMPLGRLAEVLAQKVYREGSKTLPFPYVAIDMFVLIRQAMRTYDLLFYLNADDRRATDVHWKASYSIVVLPLIRNMIDCLFDITLILQDPKANGEWFRRSGFKKALMALDEDEERYGGDSHGDSWIERNRTQLELGMRQSGMTVADVKSQKVLWPTLGKYVLDKGKGGTTTRHQDYLRTFTYISWREYSAMAHGAFEGLMPTAMYYVEDTFPHDERPRLQDVFPNLLGTHLGRAAAVLLCISTEVQAHFLFRDAGARIDERIHEMWDALMPLFEIKELYKDHYKGLMETRGI